MLADSDVRFSSITIFACDHKLQRFHEQPGETQSPDDLDQKQKFETEIRNLIISNDITIVGDEVADNTISVVEHIAKLLGTRYLKIDMPMNHRKAVNCGPMYAEPVSADDFPSTEIWQENVLRCHRLREEHMFTVVRNGAKATDNVLIVCGLYHQLPLANRFKALARKVLLGSLESCPWFDRDRYGWSDPILQRAKERQS